MVSHSESIDSSGYPLAFPVARGTGDPRGATATRVEARSFDGHQKELLVTDGDTGDVWRLVSDEGPNLNGSDLAPFPLAFYNAAMHGDFLAHVRRLAKTMDVGFKRLSLSLDNHYTFSGSFFRGTGEGAARASTLHTRIDSDSAPDDVKTVLRAALTASPVHAAFGEPLTNVFALYVNGRRCPVRRVVPACDENETDPFIAHSRAPAPLAEPGTAIPVITKLAPDPGDRRPKMLASEGVVPITVRGSSEISGSGDTVATTVLPPAPGSRFRLLAATDTASRVAPTAPALAAAGVAFCFMTQLSRYIEHRKYEVHGIRVVQKNSFTAVDGHDADARRGGCSPFETHVFLNANEPDDVLQTLLEIAENTCYLHAALRSRLPSRLEVMLNDAPLTI